MAKKPKTVQAVKGMKDILPVPTKAVPLYTALWQQFEHIARLWTLQYGCAEIRMPAVEQRAVFERAAGGSDAVQKEMFAVFGGRGVSADGEADLCLRPEGTASCMRALIEHGLTDVPRKVWYYGNMFRSERPQKGRFRQFSQLGVEAVHCPFPHTDAELIAMCRDLWERLHIAGDLHLHINTLGVAEERAAYLTALQGYFSAHRSLLPADDLRRLQDNPLRILDSKDKQVIDLLENAPKLNDFLGSASKDRFASVLAILDALGVAYTVNPYLVRGLDYYNHTVFEWVTDKLGAQSAVCGGGRYDGLLQQMGGQNLSAAGFAVGVERVLMLAAEKAAFTANCAPFRPLLFIAPVGENGQKAALMLAHEIRAADGFTGSVYCGSGRGGVAAQTQEAKKLDAEAVLVVGDKELESGKMPFIRLPQGNDAEDAAQTFVSKRELLMFLSG